MEHLSLEIFDLDGKGGSQYATLSDDATITITDTSEIFASGDVWSHSFKLNVRANSHIFGTSGELHGSRLHEQINKRRARLWVEGLPLYLGYLKLDDEADVDEDGDVDVSFDSGVKTFEDMIDGMNARDVPMLGEHLLGVAVWRDRTPCIRISYKVTASDGKNTITSNMYTTTVDLAIPGRQHLATRWPKYVEHSGTYKTAQKDNYIVNHSDTINTDYAYDDNSPLAHPYCNVDIGYQKKKPNGDVTREYTIHEVRYKKSDGSYAAWPNTAPCFYVMYWLRALLTSLGIYIEENQMQNVEDLRRLFMMNTLCAYKEPETTPNATPANKEELRLTGIYFPMPKDLDIRKEYNLTDSKVEVVYPISLTDNGGATIENLSFNIQHVQEVGTETIIGHPAYATPDNFPDIEAAKIINALQDGFGVRLLFNADFTRVRIVLLRDVFRSQDSIELQCETISNSKTENSVRGFMMTYDSDDTAFKLPAFDKLLDKEHDDDTTGSNYVLTTDKYAKIIKESSAFNKHLYYTENGNAYAYKVDKDATRYKDLLPSLFEVAGYMDAVDGKCSGADETFKSISLGFTPLIVNDANMNNERAGGDKQKFFVYVEEEMKASVKGDGVHGGIFSVSGDLFFKKDVHNIQIDVNNKHSFNFSMDVEGYIFETYTLRLEDNYEPNDEGVAPIETHDWGLTLGVMRGSGDDSEIVYMPDPNDDEGSNNDYWEIKPGSSATAHSDTCDNYGRVWDYDGRSGYKATCTTSADAKEAMSQMWPNSNFKLTERSSSTYLTGYVLTEVIDNNGKSHTILMAGATANDGVLMPSAFRIQYIESLKGKSVEQMIAWDNQQGNYIIEVNSSRERAQTLLVLQKLAYANGEPVTVSGGMDVREGRFSLKLRAEKPNPNFDSSKEENDTNPRYLTIADPNLRGRGLCDQFYKEYSYWVRNARVVKKTVKMSLAQFLTIDKAKRVHVDDITGFIKKVQFKVSKNDGFGLVDMEIIYI